MSTTTQHKATKTSSHKDGWGMSRGTYDYRGVSLAYTQRTTRRRPWHAIAYGVNDWWRVTAANKAEMMADVDRYIDELGYTPEAGRLRHPKR
jgi:hypothetical protein